MENQPLIVPEYGEPEQQSAEAQGMSKADLHLHTNLGDGTASPQRVLEMAQAARPEGHRRHRSRPYGGLQARPGADRPRRERYRDDLGLRGDDAPGPLPRPLHEAPGQVPHARRGRHRGDQGAGRPLPHPAPNGAAGAEPEPPQDRGTADTRLSHRRHRTLQSLARQRVGARAGEAAQRQWGFAGTGSSDAHFWQHIGAGYTLFPGSTAEDVRQAILNHTTRAGGQEQRPSGCRSPPTSASASGAW